MRKIISISGFDPTCGAGLGVDLKVFSSLGLISGGVITSIITQNRDCIISNTPQSETDFKEQFTTIIEEINPAVIKIGALGSLNIAKIIISELSKYPDLQHIIWDPVVLSSSGGNLLKDGSINDAFALLSDISTLITPNFNEFCQIIEKPEITRDELFDSMLTLSNKHNLEILLTGFNEEENIITDYFTFNDEIFIANEAYKREYFNFHGTGCILSSAIASYLTMEYKLPEAIIYAEDYFHNLLGISDDWLLPVGQVQYRNSSKEITKQWLEIFLREISFLDNFYELIPEVGINLSVLPYRGIDDYNDVITLSSRIIKGVNDHLITGFPTAGTSYYTARMAIIAHNINPDITVAINIKYSDNLISFLKNHSFKTIEVQKSEESEKKDFEKTLKQQDEVPDCLYSTGDFGIEAMIILFSDNLYGLLEILRLLLEKSDK